MNNQVTTKTFKTAVASRFNKAAWHYDQFAQVQHEIANVGLGLYEKHCNFSTTSLDEAATYVALESQTKLDTIVDIGCGTAKAAARLSKMANRVVGIDIAHEMLLNASSSENLNKSTTDSDQQCLFVNADMDNLPLKTESVGGVYSSMALQWCKSPQQALQEINRVLAPNGKALIAIMVGESFNSLHKAWHLINKPSRINKFYESCEWIELLGLFDWQSSYIQKTFTTHHHSLLDMLGSIKSVGANTRIHSNSKVNPSSSEKCAVDEDVGNVHELKDNTPSLFFPKSEIKALSAKLQNEAGESESLALQYELLFISIQKNEQ